MADGRERWRAGFSVIDMPQFSRRNREVSPRLNKSKIGFNGAGGVKIARGTAGQAQTFYPADPPASPERINDMIMPCITFTFY
jgi:hypothetical protein